MARINAMFDAEDEVETFDLPSERSGRIAGFRLDGIDVYLTLPRPFDGKDARIAETCDRLIGVLAGLRDAALARQAEPVPSDTPLGIEDDVAGEAVAS